LPWYTVSPKIIRTRILPIEIKRYYLPSYMSSSIMFSLLEAIFNL